jgi:hypothetical protein
LGSAAPLPSPGPRERYGPIGVPRFVPGEGPGCNGPAGDIPLTRASV